MWIGASPSHPSPAWIRHRGCASRDEASEDGRDPGLLHERYRTDVHDGELRQGGLLLDPADLLLPDAGLVEAGE